MNRNSEIKLNIKEGDGWEGVVVVMNGVRQVSLCICTSHFSSTTPVLFNTNLQFIIRIPPNEILLMV